MSKLVSNPGGNGIRFFDSRTDEFINDEGPAPAPAPSVDTTRAHHLAHDLILANPDAKVRVDPDQRNPTSDSRMIRITGTGLDLMSLMDLPKYELVATFYRATRSGIDAVVVIVCKPLDR